MNEQDAAELALLSEAMLKAQALVAELKRVQAEAEQSPPQHLSPDELAQGRAALAKAVESAQRMLGSLQQAAVAHPSNEDVPPA